MTAGPTKDPLELKIESSAFPGSAFKVHTLSGREAVSQLFHFEVGLVSVEDEGPDVRAIVGSDVSIVFEQAGAELRRIHGVIAEAHDVVSSHIDHRSYRIHVVPRAHRLAMIESSETFMNVTVPDLIKQKLALVGLGDSELRLLGSYSQRELVTQFRETDLAFISRLCEHVGISYFFEHGSGQDIMVFTDMAAGFQPAPRAEVVQLRLRGEEIEVFSFEARARVIPSVYVVRDYNYRTPLVDLTAEQPIPDGFAGGIIEFGSHYKTPAEGKVLAEARADEKSAEQLVYTGKSALCAIASGARSTLEGHPQLGSVEMTVLEVQHSVTQPVQEGERSRYVNSFRAIPATRTYRPPRVTPKPVIAGLVNAIVDAGPAGDADHAQIDDQGRYLVRFLFDTAAGGVLPSRPVRMLQNHAGENYGTHFPLKPGVEVAIAFINGDPDRPLIVGAVPNPLTPSPVDAKNRTTHRIRTKAGIRIDLVDE